jgi:putative intracellular protease/amidase
MRRRLVFRIALGLAAIGAIGFGGWLLTLPPAPAIAAPAPIAADETAATLAALRPPKRRRPLVAIIGLNDATETTDYLMPYGILKRADVADVVALATGPGPITLFPALRVQPDATLARFDARHPEGADYVIVPAMSRNDDPTALAWIRRQAERGAIIVSVCAGARVIAAAGLLDGRRATTHWYYLKGMRDAHPAIHYVPDRRFVVDRGVATTTGITASMPMMLTLIEAIAGRPRAEAAARELGLAGWDARHDSAAFRFSRPFALGVIGNRAAVWRHERLGIALTPGMDEVSLALAADAWSRTYRSRALTFAPDAAPRPTRSGLRVLPDEVAAAWPAETRLPDPGTRPPARVLDDTLGAITDRYGPRTTYVVAMQLEYPGLAPPR